MAKIIAGCKHCGHLFKIEDLFEGIDVECPKCGQNVIVSRVADRDERGLPVFSEDMDQILDQIYKKAEQMEQVTDMDQIEQMAETLEVDQEALAQVAAARAAQPAAAAAAGAPAPVKKPPTKYKVTRPSRERA
jgi:predicted  nucleic acid-binding Zn-ribbon protein